MLAIVVDRTRTAILGTTRWSTGNGGASECDGQMNLGNGQTKKKKWRTEGRGRVSAKALGWWFSGKLKRWKAKATPMTGEIQFV